MPLMDADQLRRHLEFYEDLGIKTLYRRELGGAGGLAAGEANAIELPPMAPSNDSILKIIEDMGDCKRCRLHAGRNKIVFGVGSEKSPLVFVGEGPGAD